MSLFKHLDIAEKKFSELENRTTEMIQMGHKGGKRLKMMTRESVNCGITSSGLTLM